jgi:CubicO group peptidase (beta-lactamase class C family)
LLTTLNNRILKKIKAQQPFDFEGGQAIAYHRGQKCLDIGWGKTYKLYDIASLTKIVFTTLWFMKQYEQDSKILNRKVVSILPWYKNPSVTVGSLLNHSAGNTWWQAFYKEIPTDYDSLQAYVQMDRLCRQAPLSKSKTAVYSDIDFFLLGSIMQKMEQKTLHKIWLPLKKEFLPESQFHFNLRHQYLKKKTDYAPTESCSWRGSLQRGQVHDENAWALGGVAPHAGLFARIKDMATYGLLLREIAQGRQKHISKRTLKKFITRSLASRRGDWGYGFMLPSHKGSSAGEQFSRTSFGHTGFTGTSFWYDDQRDLFLCLLSNRVYPTRKSKDFQKLRPQIHDWLIQEIQ